MDINELTITKVWLNRAEGPTALCGEKTFEDLALAESELMAMARTAPSTGGHDKIDFRVFFSDNKHDYSGRIDLKACHVSGYSIIGHMVSYLTCLSNNPTNNKDFDNSELLESIAIYEPFETERPDTCKELLPGAVGNYDPRDYWSRNGFSKALAVKALRNDYGVELGYAIKLFKSAYPSVTIFRDTPSHLEDNPDNPQVEQIETLRDLQRQMLDVLDGLKECRDEIERGGNNGIAARLNTYVIAHIECSVTSEHEWLDSSTSIDSIIEELEEE